MRRLVTRSDGEPPRRQAAYRRTRRQAFGQGLRLGVLIGAACAGLILAGLADRWLGGIRGPRDSGWWMAAAFVGPVALVTVVYSLLGVRVGVDVDHLGLHPVPPWSRSFGPWSDVIDLRAERRRQRTVVAAYLASGRVLRLRAPYDGPLLDHDPDFERKFFMLQNVWETHRNWRNRAIR